MAALLANLDPERGADWSGALIDRFGSLGTLLWTSREAISGAVGDARVAALLSAVCAAHLHVAREQLGAGPVLSSGAALTDYLALMLRDRPREVARVLYLNAANRLLRDEGCAEGSPLEVVIHPREVVRRALELGATALILVHNHPSGDPTPSRADRDATRRLAAAAALLDIRLHDHVIVASGGCASFRALGLL